MLNQAHWLHRQAEKATRKGRYEEAIERHREAAKLLNDILEGGLTDKARLSIRLQAEFHNKETGLLQKYSERIHKLEDELKKFKASELHPNRRHSNIGTAHFAANKMKGNTLQSSIHRAFEETESLLDQLRDDPYSQSCPVKEEQTRQGSKKPKDDKVIIEELEVANSHLRKMVDSLFAELDQSHRENLDLKARIAQLEAQLGAQRVISALPPVTSEVPELEPLEMPTFDFEK